MIIKQIPEGFNSISEVLQSKEFKAFKKDYLTIPKPVPQAIDGVEQEPAPSILELYLKSLKVCENYL